MSVKITHSQMVDPDDTGTPLSVAAGELALVVPTAWYDKQGRPHHEMFFVTETTVYRDPKGEEWAHSLKSVDASIADQVRARMKSGFRQLLRGLLVDVLKEEDMCELLQSVLQENRTKRDELRLFDEVDQDVTDTSAE